jgi:hypothetical protein
MADRKEIIASLEGARIFVENGICYQDEYDFSANQWCNRDTADWPMTRTAASDWVHGWNQFDAFAAIQVLITAQTQG